MENENKGTPNGGEAKKNKHHRRKPHKPKAYYITPNGETAAPEVTIKAEQPKANKEQRQKYAHQQVKHHIAQKPNQNEEKAEHREEKHNDAEGRVHTQSRNARRRNKNRAKRQNEATQIQTGKQAGTADVLHVDLMPTAKASRSDKLEPMPKKLDKFSASADYAKYSDYEEFTVEELYGTDDKTETDVSVATEVTDTAQENESVTQEATVEVVGIRFKASGKTYYFEPEGITLGVGAHAIVKTARGLEYGEVAIANTYVKESDTVPPLRPVVRAATKEDIAHHDDNKRREQEAFHICNEKIIAHGLDMKLIDAQYTFDNTKLLFYFTSQGRVDFRELVKDLAAVFRTRIELRQIGIRDEAKMVGGLGICGRPLCCSVFLTDFGQVTIKMAKDQNLSLSSKASGVCGRLMCCLRYEYEGYEYEIKRTPPVDSLVRTVDGVGVVTEINPLAGTIKVKLNNPADVPPKTYHRNDVTVLKKKKEEQ